MLQGMHNLDDSITSFARCCFNYALDTRQNLWLGGKDTISKIYDGRFKEIFATIYEDEFKEKFEAAGIEYFYSLIDDIVARVMKAEADLSGPARTMMRCYERYGFFSIWFSGYDDICTGISTGYYEYEAAHGTVQRHYYRYLKGEETSTNSVATIFAWTGALRKRGELDGNKELMEFADKLEKATLETIESGKMTKDLALITSLEDVTVLNSKDFILAIRERLDEIL